MREMEPAVYLLHARTQWSEFNYQYFILLQKIFEMGHFKPLQTLLYFTSIALNWAILYFTLLHFVSRARVGKFIN